MGAQLLGGPLFAPIGYLPEHRPTEQEWDWAVAAFRDLGDLLDKNKMTLSIEPVNRSETFFVRTARQAERLCAAIDHPRVGVTIDTFHANIEEQSIPGAIESLGSRLRHLHLSENDRSVLGSGHIHFPEILEAAKKAEYTGYYTSLKVLAFLRKSRAHRVHCGRIGVCLPRTWPAAVWPISEALSELWGRLRRVIRCRACAACSRE